MNTLADVEEAVDAVDRSKGLAGCERFPITVERILVPTDLSAGSDQAIEYALVLAQRFGAHLTLLHVYKEPYAVEYLRGPHAADAVAKERLYFKQRLESLAKELKKVYADCDFEFRDGQPCEEIVKVAKEQDADLIVISTHRYDWLTRLAYGCHAEEILRHAPCPLLILQVNSSNRDKQVTRWSVFCGL